MSAQKVFEMVRRHALVTLVVCLAGVCATVALIVWTPRSYQSRAKLLLSMGREHLAIDPSVTSTGETASLYRTTDSEVQTALHMMSSRNILEKVLDDVGQRVVLTGSIDAAKDADLDSENISTRREGGTTEAQQASSYVAFIQDVDPVQMREQAVLALEGGLEIAAQRDSRVVDVSYQTKSPLVAQLIVNSWVKNYLVEHARMNIRHGSLEFFEAEEQQVLESLDAAREKLRAMKTECNLVTIEGEQSSLEKQVEWVNNVLLTNSSQMAASKSRLDSLIRQQNETSEMVVTRLSKADRNNARDQMRDRLYALEIEQKQLEARYTVDHPLVVAKRAQQEQANQIFQLQTEEQKNTEEGSNPLYTSLQIQIATERAGLEALIAEAEAARQLREDMGKRREQLNRQESKIYAAQRQVDVLEHRFRQLFEKREQARLARKLEEEQVTNINVIQHPTLEEKPVSPNKKLCAFLGILGTAVFAIGIAVLREGAYHLRQEQPHASNTAEISNSGNGIIEALGRRNGHAQAVPAVD